MGVVQVRGHRRHSEAGIVRLGYRRQGVDVASKAAALAVKRLVGRARAACAGAIVEAPDGLDGQVRVGRLPDAELPLVELVQGPGHDRKPEWELMMGADEMGRHALHPRRC